MMDMVKWMTDLTGFLQKAFGERLLFVGLQGSRRRGEAGPDSDIDVVTILNRLEMADLKTYKSIIAAQPEGQKACGFISGRDELREWPRAELFQFARDTESYFGNLEDFLPKLSDQEAREALRNGAAGLYHLVAHQYLYAFDGRDFSGLKEAYKAAAFLLILKHYLESGEYLDLRRQLRAKLRGPDLEIMDLRLHWPEPAAAPGGNSERYYQLLLEWSSALLLDQTQA